MTCHAWRRIVRYNLVTELTNERISLYLCNRCRTRRHTKHYRAFKILVKSPVSTKWFDKTLKPFMIMKSLAPQMTSFYLKNIENIGKYRQKQYVLILFKFFYSHFKKFAFGVCPLQSHDNWSYIQRQWQRKYTCSDDSTSRAITYSERPKRYDLYSWDCSKFWPSAPDSFTNYKYWDWAVVMVQYRPELSNVKRYIISRLKLAYKVYPNIDMT